MKKRIMVGLVSMMIAGSASAVWYNAYQSGNWDGLVWGSPAGASTTPPPGVADDVYLDNDHTVALNVDSTVNSLWIARDAPAGTFAVLNVNAGKTLTVNNALRLGTASPGTDGTLNVTDGTVVAKGSTTIAANSLIDINGGTLTIDNSTFKTMNGAGLIKLQSGTLSTTGLLPGTAAGISTDIEISGGTINMGQTYFGEKVTVFGDAASITVGALNSQPTGINGDYVFVMDSDGISTIASSNFMTLDGSTIAVDGSAYTGGTGTFPLFTSGNLTSMASDYSDVTGFTGGLSGSIAQDGNNVILTVIPEPATLGMIAVFGGGILFVRRMFHT